VLHHNRLTLALPRGRPPPPARSRALLPCCPAVHECSLAAPVTRMGLAMFFPPLRLPKSKVRFVACECQPAESLVSVGMTFDAFSEEKRLPPVMSLWNRRTSDLKTSHGIPCVPRKVHHLTPFRLGSRCLRKCHFSFQKNLADCSQPDRDSYGSRIRVTKYAIAKIARSSQSRSHSAGSFGTLLGLNHRSAKCIARRISCRALQRLHEHSATEVSTGIHTQSKLSSGRRN
jgi:hypothetical protein